MNEQWTERTKTLQIADPSSEAQIPRALVADSDETTYTPTPGLDADTFVNLQALADNPSGTSTIGPNGALQESTNLVDWTQIPGSTTTVLTVEPEPKHERDDGGVSGYIRVKFDNTGTGECIVRVRFSTMSAPA